jgi:preprotein translocase subunit SecE
MTNEQVERSKNIREMQWFAVAAFTAIALVSMTRNFADNINNETHEVKWAVSAVCIALTLSILAVVANFFLKDKFVGTNMETGMVRESLQFFVSS